MRNSQQTKKNKKVSPWLMEFVWVTTLCSVREYGGTSTIITLWENNMSEYDPLRGDTCDDGIPQNYAGYFEKYV